MERFTKEVRCGEEDVIILTYETDDDDYDFAMERWVYMAGLLNGDGDCDDTELDEDEECGDTDCDQEHCGHDNNETWCGETSQ